MRSIPLVEMGSAVSHHCRHFLKIKLLLSNLFEFVHISQLICFITAGHIIHLPQISPLILKASAAMKTGNAVLYPVRHIKNIAHKAGRMLSEDQIRQILEQAYQDTSNQGHVNKKTFKTYLTFLVKSFIGAGRS